jgi:hypothetical protein
LELINTRETANTISTNDRTCVRLLPQLAKSLVPEDPGSLLEVVLWNVVIVGDASLEGVIFDETILRLYIRKLSQIITKRYYSRSTDSCQDSSGSSETYEEGPVVREILSSIRRYLGDVMWYWQE